MVRLVGICWVVMLVAVRLTGGELPLPARAPGAATGSVLAERWAGLDRVAREEAAVAEILRGNVPASWRRFVTVPVEGGGTIEVAPDYLAVGTDEDHLYVPLSPEAAQQVADALDCVLPTRRLVDLLHAAAPLKLVPAPIPPSAAMTTLPVMAAHSRTVVEQRRAAGAAFPPGTLVAGHKKDIVITPRLAAQPTRVAIYGWHRPDGRPIQPLYLGHTRDWVDYSHGVRLVRRTLRRRDAVTTIDAVLADPATSGVLSDEGPFHPPRYPGVPVTPTK